MKIFQTIYIIIVLLCAIVESKSDCPASKYGIIPVWPSTWTNSDKTNWYQLMYSKGNGFIQTSLTWIEVDNLINSKQLTTYVNYIKDLKANYNLKYHLSIKNPATNVNHVPSEYTGMNFRDTVLKNAYYQFAKRLIDSFANVVDYLSVGVESDFYFKNHPNEIEEFTELFSSISDYVHLNYPKIKISSAITFIYGIKTNDTLWQSIKDFSDVLCITYWPLKNDFTVISTAITDIATDMNTLIQKAGLKPIIIKEWGFPSSKLVNSSDLIQSNFVKEMFRQTINKPQIEGVEWTFLADFNSSTINSWSSFYQINSDEFKGYVGSLGLMDTLGITKPAYTAYLEMMDSVCLVSSIVELAENTSLITPNPSSEFIDINIERCAKLQKCSTSEIQIYNTLGECVMNTPSDGVRHPSERGEYLRLDVSHLRTGLYFIKFGNYYQKFMVVR